MHKKRTQQEFIDEANEKYNNFYNYLLVNFINMSKKL